MIRSTMLAVALLGTPAFVLAAQSASVAPQTQQHDTTKAKSSTHSKTSSSHKSSKPAAKPATPKPAAAKPAAPKDSGSAK